MTTIGGEPLLLTDSGVDVLCMALPGRRLESFVHHNGLARAADCGDICAVISDHAVIHTGGARGQPRGPAE
jgi:hypothetical protein